MRSITRRARGSDRCRSRSRRCSDTSQLQPAPPRRRRVMHTVLRIGVPLLFALAVFGSAWYVAFRLRTSFGLQRRWLLRVLVMAALVGSFMLMVPATKSADLVA